MKSEVEIKTRKSRDSLGLTTHLLKAFLNIFNFISVSQCVKIVWSVRVWATDQDLAWLPKTISGQITFYSSDNISTDAVYPGKYTVRIIYIASKC
jgi:hypothetical protein